MPIPDRAMTTETDVKQRLAVIRATLAKATKACPDCDAEVNYLCTEVGKYFHPNPGEVAAFPSFRQVCPCTDPEFEGIPVGQVCKCEVAANHDGSIGETNQHGACFGCRLAGYHDSTCPHVLGLDERCNGLGWQVRAGGLEDGLAGLDVWQADKVWHELRKSFPLDRGGYTPMPNAPTILRKALEIVCKIKGIEVSDVQV